MASNFFNSDQKEGSFQNSSGNCCARVRVDLNLTRQHFPKITSWYQHHHISNISQNTGWSQVRPEYRPSQSLDQVYHRLRDHRTQVTASHIWRTLNTRYGGHCPQIWLSNILTRFASCSEGSSDGLFGAGLTACSCSCRISSSLRFLSASAFCIFSSCAMALADQPTVSTAVTKKKRKLDACDDDVSQP